MNMLIHTPRLIIRLFRPEEEMIYLSLFDDERVNLYLPERSRAEHVSIFKAHLNEAHPRSITGRWGIFNGQDDDFIGMCLLRTLDDNSGYIELGYALNYTYWGKGLASEMTTALLAHMWTINPGAKFAAVTDPDNIASQRVLEKTGMQRHGIFIRNGKELAYFRTV